MFANLYFQQFASKSLLTVKVCLLNNVKQMTNCISPLVISEPRVQDGKRVLCWNATYCVDSLHCAQSCMQRKHLHGVCSHDGATPSSYTATGWALFLCSSHHPKVWDLNQLQSVEPGWTPVLQKEEFHQTWKVNMLTHSLYSSRSNSRDNGAFFKITCNQVGGKPLACWSLSSCHHKLSPTDHGKKLPNVPHCSLHPLQASEYHLVRQKGRARQCSC